MYTWEGGSAVKKKINKRTPQAHRVQQNKDGPRVTQTATIQEDLDLPKENRKMSRSIIKRNLLYMSDDDWEVEDDDENKNDKRVPKNEKVFSSEKRKIFPRPKFSDLPVPNPLERDNTHNFVDHKFLQSFLNIHNLSREKSLSNPELYKIQEKRVSKYIYPREVPKSQKTKQVLSRNLSQTKLIESHREQERELEVCEVIPDHLILTKRWWINIDSGILSSEHTLVDFHFSVRSLESVVRLLQGWLQIQVVISYKMNYWIRPFVWLFVFLISGIFRLFIAGGWWDTAANFFTIFVKVYWEDFAPLFWIWRNGWITL